ncbi:MAG TPA: hypothetical protein VFG49_15570 [Dyella sp.]|uniref:DUF6868 family protein n=1 Tax=Dyella sp. TaxID=1869338 RepID=UPI002D7926C3|nr:hypothetical protein [Dyella sp.]HET6554945.1 hypothetical protein [Dyella sp.]
MTVQSLRAVLGWAGLGWAAIFNLALVTVWFALFRLLHGPMYALHRRWFRLSEETFDAIHYAGMAWYKTSTWMFFILPYCALRLAS